MDIESGTSHNGSVHLANGSMLLQLWKLHHHTYSHYESSIISNYSIHKR